MQYGLYDTKDNLWLGDDKGPILHEDKMLALMAAQVISKMLGDDPLRAKARPFENKGLKKKDEVKAKMLGAEAIRRIEEGSL